MARTGEPSGSPKGDVEYPALPPSIEDLRKEAAARRTSLPNYDFLDRDEDPEDAKTPWDIASTDQLKQWVSKDPHAVLLALDQLRRQRDLGIEASSLYEDLHQEKETLASQLKIEKDRRRQAVNRADRLKADLQAAEARIQASRDSTPASQISAKRSQKLPDPSLFDNGKEPTWDDWINKIRYKLEVNHDHFDNERAKIGYILSRLQGQASSHTYARSPQSSADPYTTVDEVIKDLAEIYEDPDKERNYRRQYNALLQGNQRFVDFYSEFKRLSSHLGYGENQLVDDLRDKLAPRLRSAWSSQVHQLTKLSEIRAYLARVDNEFRSMRELKEKDSTNELKPRTPRRVAFSTTTPSSKSPPPRRPSPANEQHASDEKTGNCFICHLPGHVAADCPESARRPTPYTPPARRALQVHVDAIDKEYDRSSSDSDSEN